MGMKKAGQGLSRTRENKKAKIYDGSLEEKLGITATQIGQNANGQTGHEKNRAKLVFFLSGGISYAERRVLKEFETANPSLDVIAGGTAII